MRSCPCLDETDPLWFGELFDVLAGFLDLPRQAALVSPFLLRCLCLEERLVFMHPVDQLKKKMNLTTKNEFNHLANLKKK